MRLIDADNLEREIDNMKPEGFRQSMAGFVFSKLIENAQTIDPVKHGHWHHVKEHAYIGGDEAKEWDNFYCSECDAPSDRPYDYCPYCGSKNL